MVPVPGSMELRDRTFADGWERDDKSDMEPDEKGPGANEAHSAPTAEGAEILSGDMPDGFQIIPPRGIRRLARWLPKRLRPSTVTWFGVSSTHDVDDGKPRFVGYSVDVEVPAGG